MPAGPLLQVRDLSVELPGRNILQGIGFQIPPGSITGVCGESGCGKTTLALALVGLLPSPPYRVRGSVLLNGTDLTHYTEKQWEAIRGARIGFVFQDPQLALNPVLSINTQIHEILRAHHMENDPAELLRLAGLLEAERILHAYPHQLSGGERQRTTIALALACRPELIIADEPFTALDGPRIVELAALFRRLRDETGASFLLISHSPRVLAATAGEVLRLSAGRLVAVGTPREVLRRGR